MSYPVRENIDRIGSIYILSNNDIAKNLLLRAARECVVMMKRRGLYVDELREMFYDHEQGLYGYNEMYGERHTIHIRLRWDEKTFLEYHDVLGTLLHELVHNTIHNHSPAFYKLLEEYENEVYSNGSVFRGTGHKPFAEGGCRLGGRKKTATQQTLLAEAAERRRGTTNILGGIKKKMTPREACAAAAEKRFATSE